MNRMMSFKYRVGWLGCDLLWVHLLKMFFCDQFAMNGQFQDPLTYFVKCILDVIIIPLECMS